MKPSLKNIAQTQQRIWQDEPFSHLFKVIQIDILRRGTTGRAFKLQCQDGHYYKLRVCVSPKQAEFVASRIQTIPQVFPKLYGTDRQYLLTDFVPGQNLGYQYAKATSDIDTDLKKWFYKMGELHGLVHKQTHACDLIDADESVIKTFKQLEKRKILSKSTLKIYQTYYEKLRQDHEYLFGLDLRDAHFYNFVQHQDQLVFVDEEGLGSIQGIGLVSVLRQLDWLPGKQPNEYAKSLIEGYKHISGHPIEWQMLILNSIYHYALTLADCISKKAYGHLRSHTRKFRKFFQEESIAHINAKYLYPTQTFVYNYLTHTQKYPPLVLTDIGQNLNQFPINCRYLIRAPKMKLLKEEFGPRYNTKMKSFFQHLPFPVCYKNLIREKSLLLLHAHFGEVGYKSLKLKQATGLPLITSFYGIDASYYLSQPKWYKKFQQLFQEGDLILALGKNMAKRLRQAGCPSDKLQIQHLGINVAAIPFHVRQPPKNKPITLLFCGRLVNKKGVFDALKAFGHISQYHCQFRIIGMGPLFPKLKKRIQKMNLSKQVVLLGELNHQAVLEEMHQAHLFILPSKTAPNGDMEGTPTVLMEAQASGLPVISTIHADIPEVVQNGNTGYLAPEGDVTSLTQILENLLTEPNTWSTLGTEGRAHIDTNYNIKNEVINLEKHYSNLLAF